MESPALKHPPATLLSLPLELRHQILKYALLATCSPTAPTRGYDLSDIQVTFPIWYRHRGRPNPQTYGHWGLEPMTRIMRVNHQLLSDAIQVLYAGDFVFRFPGNATAAHFSNLLGKIGEKKSLVRKIGIEIAGRLDLVSFGGANMGVELKRQSWVILKRELVGLRSVKIRVALFKGWIKGGEEGRRRVVETLVGLMGIFRGLLIVVSEGNPWMDGEMRGIFEACRERMRNVGA